jgi:hypothetical protein
MTNAILRGRGDLAASLIGMAAFWGPGVALIALTGPLGGWSRTAGWTAGLLWLAGMCFWNYARCRRLHCIVTGPFFLAMAAAVLVAGSGLVPFGPVQWSALGGAIGLGAVILCCVPELIWGRYPPGSRAG